MENNGPSKKLQKTMDMVPETMAFAHLFTIWKIHNNELKASKAYLASNLIKFDSSVIMYKIMNGLCPDNLRRRLVTRSQISNYSTRNQLDLDTPKQNLQFSKRSFVYSGAKT